MKSSAYQEIKPKLRAGERLLWSGRPRNGIQLRRKNSLFILYLIALVGGAALLWLVVTRTTGFFTLIAVLIYCSFAWQFLDRFVIDIWRRNATVYGLTDRRVIIIAGLFDRQSLSLPLQTLSDITLHKGSGTISCIGEEGYWHKRTKRGELVKGSLFRLLVDGQYVFDLLLEAQAKALTPEGTWSSGAARSPHA